MSNHSSFFLMKPIAYATAMTLCLMAVPASAVEDAGAQGLLAKHRAFVGWQLGDGTLSSMRLTGRAVNTKGETTASFSTVSEGLVYRTTFSQSSRAGLQRDEGFTGNIFWQSNVNGFTTPAFGDPAKAALAEDLLFNEALSGLTGTLRGSANVDGKATQIVRVTLKDDYPIDLYVDPDSGAFVQAVIDPDGSSTETIHVLGYTEALPGKKIIGSYRYGRGSTWTVAKIDANPAVTNDDLHPPPPRATWAFSNPAPFGFKVTDTRFIVDAKINGTPGRFIIDTGADGIYLTREFGVKAGVKALTSESIGGIAGTARGNILKLDSVDIGGNVLSNVVANSIPDSMDPDAPDGVIGFDLFGGAVVRLNASAQQLTISDPSAAQTDASAGIPLNVDLSDGVPNVPMKMDGRIPVSAELDSGNFYYVLFGKELITRYGLAMLVDNSVVGMLQSHPAIGGVGGYEVESCGHVDSLTLGPIVYQQPPACESSSFSGRDILVGYDFLRHFDYIFDYPHGHLIMIPHKE